MGADLGPGCAWDLGAPCTLPLGLRASRWGRQGEVTANKIRARLLLLGPFAPRLLSRGATHFRREAGSWSSCATPSLQIGALDGKDSGARRCLGVPSQGEDAGWTPSFRIGN